MSSSRQSLQVHTEPGQGVHHVSIDDRSDTASILDGRQGVGTVRPGYRVINLYIGSVVAGCVLEIPDFLAVIFKLGPRQGRLVPAFGEWRRMKRNPSAMSILVRKQDRAKQQQSAQFSNPCGRRCLCPIPRCYRKGIHIGGEWLDRRSTALLGLSGQMACLPVVDDPSDGFRLVRIPLAFQNKQRSAARFEGSHLCEGWGEHLPAPVPIQICIAFDQGSQIQLRLPEFLNLANQGIEHRGV
ncbi:hypothetical protein DM194_15110 (plasmid) [Azospirillum ramasamyi]|uniref:Uncharacterized protein n=1 Tax=Azospirillum ramasamyi TaxID=682998 RepID=A0A2U9SCE1_9PROT|nr:hypothetical protein DM194_15110 [Azospirillum ramasamyi]